MAGFMKFEEGLLDEVDGAVDEDQPLPGINKTDDL